MTKEERYNRMVIEMMEHVENGTTDQAADVLHLPTSVYTDQQRWKREMETVFKRLPIMVAMTHEMPNEGDYKSIDILDTPLLLTRQKDGSVRALLNVCTHRGMTLAPEGCGNKRIFTCPYHAWSYSNDGQLRGIAEAPKFGDVPKCSRDLVQFPVYERGGLIFAVLQPGTDYDFESFLGAMMDDVAAKQFENWSYMGQRTMQGANWKIAYDGYLEGYHFAAAHPETIHPRTFSNIMAYDCEGPHVFIGFPQRSILKLRDVPEQDLWKHENDGYDFIRLFFPNLSIFVAPEFTSISQMIPGPTVRDNRTIIHFVHPEAPKDEQDKAERDGIVDWLAGVVEEEDYGVGLQVQRGLRSGHQPGIVFGRNERANQYFHRWLDYYVNGDKSAPHPVL